MLRPELGKWIPAGIKKYEQGTDVVFGSDGNESVDSLFEAGGILLPEQVMQEHAHGVHAQAFGPAEFLVDLLRIESGCLPHLEFVDRVGWYVVASHQPGL